MTNAGQMLLSDYLCIPYLLKARRVELSPGVWVSQVAYPELPDCHAESADLESALRQLERRRIVILIGMIDSGKLPPVPRPPLASSDPVWIAEKSDVPADILTRIQRDGTAAPGPR